MSSECPRGARQDLSQLGRRGRLGRRWPGQVDSAGSSPRAYYHSVHTEISSSCHWLQRFAYSLHAVRMITTFLFPWSHIFHPVCLGTRPYVRPAIFMANSLNRFQCVRCPCLDVRAVRFSMFTCGTDYSSHPQPCTNTCPAESVAPFDTPKTLQLLFSFAHRYACDAAFLDLR